MARIYTSVSFIVCYLKGKCLIVAVEKLWQKITEHVAAKQSRVQIPYDSPFILVSYCTALHHSRTLFLSYAVKTTATYSLLWYGFNRGRINTTDSAVITSQQDA